MRYLCSSESSSDKEYYLAIAFGSSLNGKHPGYHGSTGYFKSEGHVNLMAIQKVSSESSLSAFVKGHGIFMTMGWLLFATCGIFMSRYMKTVWNEKIYGKDRWFRMHQIFMFSTVTCFIMGFILILFELKGKWSTTAGTHHVLGLIAIILGLLQPCVALLRCSPDHEKRYIFNWVHRTIGMVAWLIAAITIVFGLKLVGLDTNSTVVIIFIPVTAVLFVTLDLLRIWNTKYNKDELTASSQVTYSATQSLIETEYRKSNNEKRNLKLILTVTMAVFYVFAALVVIVIAINIGKF